MKIIEWLQDKKPGVILDSHEKLGNETIFIARDSLLDLMQFLKHNEDYPFDMLLDICGVDYDQEQPRFEVVYHLYSVKTQARIRIRVKLEEEDLKIASVDSLWKAANWFEREAFDMFGIIFEGHPQLERILMWDDFEGHPLRKDYPLERRQPIPEPKDIL